MPAYPKPSRNDRHAPMPGTETAVALRATNERLRQQAADAARRNDELRRQLGEADGRANAAENRLTALRAVLARALGGPGSYPDGATEVDMAEALRQSLVYARNTATRAHERRRVNEVMTARLLRQVQELEAQRVAGYAADARTFTLTAAGLAALAEPETSSDG